MSDLVSGPRMRIWAILTVRSRRDVLRNPAPGQARNVPPAPPAPGAGPQVNGNADPANPLQAVYNQYFGLPRDRQPAPPGATVAPTPAPVANGHPPDANTAPEAEEARIQRSIWGGPIVPGRFFPTPLGAAPRLPSTRETVTGLSDGPAPSQRSPSRTRVPVGPPPPIQTGPEIVTPSQPSVRPSTSRSTPSTPVLASGANTPFSSNPPQVFRSTSESRHAEDENDARRQAADAALRRMGLQSGTVVADVVEQSGTTQPRSEAEVTSLPNLTRKEKGKADTFDAPPQYVPYMSIPQPLPRTRPWTPVGDTRAALGERLRVLRDVDEVVWGLVAELTRLGSAWESEDVAAGQSGAVVAGREDGAGEGT